MSKLRLFGWAYCALFILVVASGFIPAFLDEQGRQFGLFTLDLYDHGLHLFSGLWAGAAAAISDKATRTYFRLFGPLYFADGVLGLLTGSGYLDFGIFLYGRLELDLMTRFFANLPHFIIGGGAIWVGYVFARERATA